MHEESVETVIIGAGLSGLYAAYLLAGQGKSFMVLEARDRPGGRILSPRCGDLPADLGPSWFWPDIQPRMVRLIKSLGLSPFRHYEQGFGATRDRAATLARSAPIPWNRRPGVCAAE